MIEILNGIKETINYEENSSLKLYVNEDYEDYPFHWHTGLEIIMPLHNWYDILIDEETYRLREYDIIFINTGVIHGLVAPPTGDRLILQFDLSLLYNLKRFDTTLFMMSPASVITSETHPKIYPELRSNLLRILEEYTSDNILKEMSIYGLLVQIYATLCREEIYQGSNFNHTTKSKQHEYIEKFMDTCSYINEHLTDNLTLEKVASTAGFSKFHFSRLFKDFANMTFYDYLNQRRIRKAESLLSDTELNITTVAMNSGFSSLSSFNRTFKMVNGCSPSSFRKKLIYSREV